jgi:hypothetical protein
MIFLVALPQTEKAEHSLASLDWHGLVTQGFLGSTGNCIPLRCSLFQRGLSMGGVPQ